MVNLTLVDVECDRCCAPGTVDCIGEDTTTPVGAEAVGASVWACGRCGARWVVVPLPSMAVMEAR